MITDSIHQKHIHNHNEPSLVHVICKFSSALLAEFPGQLTILYPIYQPNPLLVEQDGDNAGILAADRSCLLGLKLNCPCRLGRTDEYVCLFFITGIKDKGFVYPFLFQQNGLLKSLQRLVSSCLEKYINTSSLHPTFLTA